MLKGRLTFVPAFAATVSDKLEHSGRVFAVDDIAFDEDLQPWQRTFLIVLSALR